MGERGREEAGSRKEEPRWVQQAELKKQQLPLPHLRIRHRAGTWTWQDERSAMGRHAAGGAG